jgi:hypothetical protein
LLSFFVCFRGPRPEGANRVASEVRPCRLSGRRQMIYLGIAVRFVTPVTVSELLLAEQVVGCCAHGPWEASGKQDFLFIIKRATAPSHARHGLPTAPGTAKRPFTRPAPTTRSNRIPARPGFAPQCAIGFYCLHHAIIKQPEALKYMVNCRL